MANRGNTTCTKCGKEEHHSKGLCKTCYNQCRRRLIVCTGCGRLKKRYRKTLCSPCYRHQNIIDSCAECDKKKPHYAKGLCKPCYDHRARPLITCVECGEKKTHQAIGMCSKCYFRKHNKKRQEWKAAYNHKWQKKNPDKAAAGFARRRARKNSLPDTLTLEENKELLAIGQGTYPEEKLVLDHFIPLGAEKNKACGTTRANMHYIPASLNLTKNVKSPEEIYKQLKLSLPL